MKYRKHIRLKNYDYSSNGYYFVTIVTHNRLPLFVAAPSYGAKSFRNIVDEKIQQISKYYSGVSVDYYKVMPEHIHMIIVLEDVKVTLAKIVNAFKSWITRDIKKILASQGDKTASQGDAATNKLVYIFQPNYYKHIIRNEKALDKIRKYIEFNPDAEKLNWEELEK